MTNSTSDAADVHIDVRDVTMRYDDRLIQSNLNFTIQRGDIFVIMAAVVVAKVHY